MKRIRCPKCGTPIQFDETLYEPGRILVFQCPDCLKEFRIRIPQKANSKSSAQATSPAAGTLIVLENDFQYRQEIPLQEGTNVIGKAVKCSRANATFTTVDPSIDPIHCSIEARTSRDGTHTFFLKDENSNTGTFLMNQILGKKECQLLEDGAVINIGAATLILHV